MICARAGRRRHEWALLRPRYERRKSEIAKATAYRRALLCLLGNEEGDRICVVDLHRRHEAFALDLQLLAADCLEATDHVVEHRRGLLTVVKGHAVALAIDDEDAVLCAAAGRQVGARALAREQTCSCQTCSTRAGARAKQGQQAAHLALKRVHLVIGTARTRAWSGEGGYTRHMSSTEQGAQRARGGARSGVTAGRGSRRGGRTDCCGPVRSIWICLGASAVPSCPSTFHFFPSGDSSAMVRERQGEQVRLLEAGWQLKGARAHERTSQQQQPASRRGRPSRSQKQSAAEQAADCVEGARSRFFADPFRKAVNFCADNS